MDNLMSLFDLLLTPAALPFAVALCLMLALLGLELLSLLLGVTASTALDNLLPDISLEQGNLSFFTTVLNWLQVGRVPSLILLVLWLAAFGLSGALLQQLSFMLSGQFLPVGLLAVPLALLCSLPLVPLTAGWSVTCLGTAVRQLTRMISPALPA